MGRVVILCFLFAFTQSAFIQRRNIPVEIIYNENGMNVQDTVAKRQISADNGPIGTENLHEKSQLSLEERSEAVKHLPHSQSVIEQNIQSDSVEQPRPSNFIIDTAQDIIHAGLQTIRVNVEKAASLNHALPTEESWRNLNKTLEDFFVEQYKDVGLKQDQSTQAPTNQNGQNQIIQNIVNGFQNLASNFVQGLQQNNNPSPGNGTEDEQQQPAGGFLQNFVSQFSGGIQQISNNINNIASQPSTSNTVLGDTGSPSTERPNFINNVVQSVQQFFNQNQGSQGGNQSDTGVPGGSNFFQGAINNINQAISNFRPPVTLPPSGTQGDEGTSTTQRGPIEIFQNIGNQISSFFGQGQSSKPPEDETTSSTQSTNFIQNIGQAIQGANPIGQAIQGANPFGQGGSEGSNPVSQGVQQVNNQIQQFVGSTNVTNPVETIQNAIGGVTGGKEGSQNQSEIIEKNMNSNEAMMKKNTDA